MFKIIRADQPIEISRVWVLMYGEPGIGKTTSAFSAKNPILINFNKTGVNRAKNRKDFIDISDWATLERDKKDIVQAIKDYDTVIFDTIEDMLNLLGTHLKESDYKLRKGGFAFWGALRDGFRDFINIIDANNKDVIFLTHIKEKDEGEVRIKRPLISGQSYDFIIGLSDFIGYMHAQGSKRILDFNVADTHYGKNPAGFQPLEVPHYEIEPDFMTNIVAKMKLSLTSSNEASKKVVNRFISAKEELQAMNGVKVNVINDYLQKYTDLGKAHKKELFTLVKEKCASLGYEYDKDAKLFVDNTPVPEAEQKKATKNAVEPEPEPVLADESETFFDEEDF